MGAFSVEEEELSAQTGHGDPLAWEAAEGGVSGAVTEKALDMLDEDPVCFQTGPEGIPHSFPPGAG